MDNLKIYCMCLDHEYLKAVKKHNYIPVGLKNKNFSNEWLTDDTLINISEKNPYYGEYTFYYWYWKNMLKDKKENDWIGFCSYRELWGDKKDIADKHSTKYLLKSLPEEWKDYETIIGEPFKLKKPRFSKILKYGKLALLRNFKEIIKANWSIRFQFDMFHGNGILDKAIELLGQSDREDFKLYVTKNISFNYGNMFICKSKELMIRYYETLFPWLEKCETILGFELKGYEVRTYGFLAERFMAYWFNKNSKVHEIPVIFYDLNKEES